MLALLGSGETAPGMTKVHREILARLHEPHAVTIDTAYGFQENVPQMTEKLVSYFVTSLQQKLEPLHFASFAATSELERAIFKQKVRDADYVFAGPGSPSYALAQWQPLDLASDLTQVLERGGTVCLSSAAALTAGHWTVPVYEIYKVGIAPYWLEGLNLTALAGLNCVVIPHFDNAEGGNHDTRYCYLGERRLLDLESQLAPNVAVLGIDEHTAVFLDLAAQTITVRGRANAYWRHHGVVRVLENGSTTPLSELGSVEPPASRLVTTQSSSGNAIDELGRQAASGGPDALEAIARLTQLASTGGEGYVDPTPLVEAMLVARLKARAAAHYELADDLRDSLVNVGIDVHDGPEGSTWSWRPLAR